MSRDVDVKMLSNIQNNSSNYTFFLLLLLQIIGLLNVFTPQKTLEEFQDV